MARERMVTRTISVHTFEVMVCDTNTSEICKGFVQYTGDKPTDEKIIKNYNKSNDGLVAVRVLSCETEEVLYGMTEIDFIKYAQVMANRGAKNE